MSGLTGNISPCAACATTGEQLSAILTMLLRESGDVTSSQSQVAVNGDDVDVLTATDTARRVILQNTGTQDVYVLFGDGAVNTGAGGEHVLDRATGAGRGDGGQITVPAGYKGAITAASTGATTLSVTVFS